jgi:hypothetical protein
MMSGRDDADSGFASRLAAGKAGPKVNNMNNKRIKTTGDLILQVAEALKPGLQDELEGVCDENGMPVQPARVRGIAILIAQELVKSYMNKHAA